MPGSTTDNTCYVIHTTLYIVKLHPKVNTCETKSKKADSPRTTTSASLFDADHVIFPPMHLYLPANCRVAFVNIKCEKFPAAFVTTLTAKFIG
jgi:hypothetical protein